MKREALISFLLTVLLAAVSAIFGLVWKINDKTTDTRERLVRIETKVENLEAQRIAKAIQ